MAKNKNRKGTQSPQPETERPRPGSPDAPARPVSGGSPADLPRKRQRRFGHN